MRLFTANATGVYGGYSATLGGPGGLGGGGSSSESMTIPAQPSGSSGPPGGGGAGGGAGGMSSSSLVRNETFLRGGHATESGGVVELTTIYPGYYSGRTPHIHTMVHMNYSTSANGWVYVLAAPARALLTQILQHSYLPVGKPSTHWTIFLQ